MTSCSSCVSPAHYYCKSCKRKLCLKHVVITNTVYHCDECDKDVFESTCSTCKSETIYAKNETVYRCDWCKSSDVVDGLLYHQEMPHLIFTAIDKLNKKMAHVWGLTQRYHDLVETTFIVRQSKIMLFPHIENNLVLLDGKISIFIDNIIKFENNTFSMLDERLNTIGFLRHSNLDNLERAEEILSLLEGRHVLLERILETNSNEMEDDFYSLNQKIAYVKHQFNLLEKIQSYLPEVEGEQMISIIPRLWIRKNGNLPKKYLVVLTNKSIYLVREKGLIDVRLKLRETISLLYLVSKKYSYKLFIGKTLMIKTSNDSYLLFGSNESLYQFQFYFKIIDEYVEYAIKKTSIIEDIQQRSLTINELKNNIQKHIIILKKKVLNKREIKREFYWREGLDFTLDKLLDKLFSVERKMQTYRDSIKSGYPSTKGYDGLMNKLKREYNKIKNNIEEVRAKADKFDTRYEEDLY